MKRIPAIITALVLGAVPSWAASSHKAVEDSLKAELARAQTAADSVPILGNMYDFFPRAQSTPIGKMLYYTACRADDPVTALDILRNQANRYMSDDSMLRVLRIKALEWPESEDREETLTFIRMMDNMRRGKYGDSQDRKAFLSDLLDEMSKNNSDDIHRRIQILHGMCMVLSKGSNSELLSVYMDSLGALVKKLPTSAYSIRNAYNVHAASAYVGLDPEKAIAADRRLLTDINRLRRYYNDKGRVFRNYAPTYYTIYARLLANFEHLTPYEIEDYYGKAMAYIETDPAIKASYNRYPAPDIYYSLWKNDWHKAAHLIQSAQIPPNRTRIMMHYLMQCAESMGDKDLLLEATKRYSSVLEEELQERARGLYRELQVAYAVYDMRNHFDSLEKERAEGVAAMQRYLIILSGIALVVLVVLVILLLGKSRKNRDLAASLAKSNEQLKAESESLMVSREESVRARALAEKANNLKSDFIKNMSYEVKVPLQAITEYSRLIADCAGASGTKHITRFADMLELNAELLSTIVNDVLRLSEMESSPMPIHAQVVNVQSLCMATAEAIRHRVAPGVKLNVDTSSGRVDLFTGAARVQQILNNLLINAAKFTPKGSITLGYCESADGNTVEFSVTDTGIGINPNNKEKIFDRFVKLDRESQGAGLGLTISRLIARRLDGDLYLDTTYTGHGSRFILTLPKHKEQ